MQHQNPHKTSSPTAFGIGKGKGVSILLSKSFWFSRKTVNLLILTGKLGLYMTSRNTTASSWYAGHQPELSWKPNNSSRDSTWHWTIPANLQFPISYSCLPCSFISHDFFLIIPTHCLCIPIFTCKKKNIKVKMLTISSAKIKTQEIMPTVKSQQKKSETSLATSRSNQNYKMHNYFLSIVARYIIFIIIFHLLILVQYLIRMFHLNCLSAFSFLVQAIISCHQH